MAEEFFTLIQASRYLKASTKSLQRLRALGKITAVRSKMRNGAPLLLTKAEVERIKTERLLEVNRSRKGANIKTRLTLDDCRELGERLGLECISTEFINTSNKVQYRCANGHILEFYISNLRRRTFGCRTCLGLHTVQRE
jgi:hypothetical protein